MLLFHLLCVCSSLQQLSLIYPLIYILSFFSLTVSPLLHSLIFSQSIFFPPGYPFFSFLSLSLLLPFSYILSTTDSSSLISSHHLILLSIYKDNLLSYRLEYSNMLSFRKRFYGLCWNLAGNQAYVLRVICFHDKSEVICIHKISEKTASFYIIQL